MKQKRQETKELEAALQEIKEVYTFQYNTMKKILDAKKGMMEMERKLKIWCEAAQQQSAAVESLKAAAKELSQSLDGGIIQDYVPHIMKIARFFEQSVQQRKNR